MIGSTIGHYVIRAKLGSGAMGDVFEADDTRLKRRVAIKLLSSSVTRDPDRIARFASEARAVSALNHPNILTIHETGDSDAGPYIVTELVEGKTLREVVAEAALPIAQALDIACQAAAGLARAHDAGLVHRDIKPENLMLTHDGLVKVLDFGLAKLAPGETSTADPGAGLTMTGAVVGTPAYLSPEQLSGQSADRRSDVYALGVVLYEMLTGANPFVRDTLGATLSAILSGGAPPLTRSLPSAPGSLQNLVERATHRSPGKRFADGRDMMVAIETERTRFASGEHGVRGGPRVARVPTILLGGAAVAIAIAAAVLLPGRLSPGAGAPLALAGAADIGPRAGTMGVAILPIRDDTRDQALTESSVGRILANAFAQILIDIPGLYVVSPVRLDAIARSHERTLEQAGSDPALARQIGKEANASAVLSGTLSKLGSRYVLSATLTDIPSEHVLQTFQAHATGPESLLEELTAVVGAEFRDKYAAGGSDTNAVEEPTKGIGSVATRSFDAYTHYLRGEDLLAEGDWSGAIPELSKAIEIDPEMALAWSRLSCAFSFSGDETRAHAAYLEASDHLDHVNEMERRWIELDGLWIVSGSADLYLRKLETYIHDFPDDRDAYFYRGLAVHWLQGNPAGAIPWYEEAYGMIPNYWPVTKALVDAYEAMNARQKSLDALARYLSLPFIGNRSRRSAEQKYAELEGADTDLMDARAPATP